MVENTDDDPGETKPIFVENSEDVKPSKVEPKPNINGAPLHVKASLYIDSGGVPLHANEVDTALFFEEIKWKDRDELLNLVRRQANRAGFRIVIRGSNLINSMLQLVCERGGGHKVSKKRLKHETTGSRKCGCMFMVRGYLSRKKKDWRLNILNGVHNHEMEPSLEGHMLVGRLKENDKKLVRDLTKSLVLPKHILLNLKRKRQECKKNIKKVFIERQQLWNSNIGDKTVMQHLISKLEEHNYVYLT